MTARTRWPAALHALGVRRGDTVALMISNRPEFMIADLAAMTLGATPFSIYLTSAPDQVRYVIEDAAREVAIVEEPFVAARRGLVEHVLDVGECDEDPGFDAEPHWRAVEPDDILTLIYTSGHDRARRRASRSPTATRWRPSTPSSSASASRTARA